MGKLFNISGNLVFDETTEKLESSFNGRIVVEEDKIFGYCEDFTIYKKNMHSQLCFLTGMIIKGNDYSHGAIIYKLSNDPHFVPIMLLSTSIIDPDNSGWSRMDGFHHFSLQGKAKITFEEISPFPSRICEVCELFSKIDKTISANTELIYKLGDCEKYIAKAIAT